MTDRNVVPFLFEGESLVRVVTQNDAPWFVAADVCRAIGTKNWRDAVGMLDDDEKGVASTDTLGGSQAMTIISEGGLYTMVLRSRDATKPGTVPHRFRKWVTGEVLPAIRKTGQFAPAIEPEIQTVPEKRDFPDWPLDELRTKRGVVDMYRMCYGTLSGQWIAPQLGFPPPPRHLIELGRQMDMFGPYGAGE